MLVLQRTSDFSLDGKGSALNWSSAPWSSLSAIEHAESLATKVKALWSASGLYFLVDCEDRRLTCTFREDGADLFREDVVEVFLQPDPSLPVYFEYEISPLGHELPLLVCNSGATFHGWRPWKQAGTRDTRRAVSIRGGRKEPGASCEGWTVEFFIPFALLAGLPGSLPLPGGTWKGNIYRIDYDQPQAAHYALEPATGCHFHALNAFGTFLFA